MPLGAKSARCVCALFTFAAVTTLVVAQAPYVKTTYAVAPAKLTLWAQLHEPLSDADIARVNQELFSKGDKKAAWELGLAYMQGLGVPEDLARAEQMFDIGAITADEKAMVGMFHAHGYFPKDLRAVERWYTAAGRPQDTFELAEELKRAAQEDASAAPGYYAKATKLYLELVKDSDQPDFRLAELELGNFVIDGIYSAGEDAKGRAQNLEWVRMIAQELLGQKEYGIAVDYDIGQEDLPPDKSMWLRYCKRAAAYNIDNAQHYYVEALNNGEARDFTGFDAIAWTRLNVPKHSGDGPLLKAMTSSMTSQQSAAADAALKGLNDTRVQYGAYYVQDDPMRNPTPAVLAAMDQDDPDVQIREAFNLEAAAAHDETAYQRALALYRKVRDHRDTDARFVLGKYALTGANGVAKNRGVAEYWLWEAIRSGSQPARQLLDSIERDPKQH